MRAIYQPTGRAREYADLALNIYTGCDIGCTYCFNKRVPWAPVETTQPEMRPGLLEQIVKDCKKLQGKNDNREIHLCFTCDPYPIKPKVDMTTEVLKVLEIYGRKVSILTKNGARAIMDFPMLERNGWKFGTTLTLSLNDPAARTWEPEAPDNENRWLSIMTANAMGIYTWVSLEPVIDPAKSLHWIERLKPYVSFWKIGKLNYYPEIEKRIDWRGFVERVKALLPEGTYYLKKDLLEAAGISC